MRRHGEPLVRLPIAVPVSLGDAVEERAKVLGISVAELGRRALAAYLATVPR